MDRLSAMRVFIAVADTGSLSAAGRRLGMPLSTVSRHLASLEEQIGGRLITRTTRNLTLTEAGRGYLDACRRILEGLDEADRQVAGEEGEPQGELAVTAPLVFGRLHVLPVVTAFLKEYPRVDVRLLLLDRTVELIDEGLDIAVRVGELADSSLIATRVGAIRLVTCASPTYLKARGVPRVPQELRQHDCVTFTTLSPTDHWSFSGAKRRVRVPVRSRLIVNGAEAAVDAAVAGLGVVRVFSYQAAKPLADGSLRQILSDSVDEEVPVSIVHREGRLPRAKVRTFVNFAAGRLRKTLSLVSVSMSKRARRAG